MPGGDGTGPMGRGPMTGRGAGFCAEGYMSPVLRRGRGFGIGCGGGRGRGRGFGRGRGGGYGSGGFMDPCASYADPSYGVPYGPGMSAEQEAAMLKGQAKLMQDEINAVNKRIKELESTAEESK